MTEQTFSHAEADGIYYVVTQHLLEEGFDSCLSNETFESGLSRLIKIVGEFLDSQSPVFVDGFNNFIAQALKDKPTMTEIDGLYPSTLDTLNAWADEAMADSQHVVWQNGFLAGFAVVAQVVDMVNCLDDDEFDDDEKMDLSVGALRRLVYIAPAKQIPVV